MLLYLNIKGRSNKINFDKVFSLYFKYYNAIFLEKAAVYIISNMFF